MGSRNIFTAKMARMMSIFTRAKGLINKKIICPNFISFSELFLFRNSFQKLLSVEKGDYNVCPRLVRVSVTVVLQMCYVDEEKGPGRFCY